MSTSPMQGRLNNEYVLQNFDEDSEDTNSVISQSWPLTIMPGIHEIKKDKHRLKNVILN